MSYTSHALALINDNVQKLSVWIFFFLQFLNLNKSKQTCFMDSCKYHILHFAKNYVNLVNMYFICNIFMAYNNYQHILSVSYFFAL